MQEQYQAWHKTFSEQQRFFEQANLKFKETQVELNANAANQGLDNLMRFVETSRPYMFN